MCQSTVISTGEGRGDRQGVVHPNRFGTYNIQNGQNGGLESALRVMSQANMDLGVLHENTLIKRTYTSESSGYRVVATKAPSTHSSGVAVFYREVEHFSVEALQTYGANVIFFHMVSGDRRWFIVGCYLAPDEAWTTEDVVAAIINWTWGAALLVIGNFNTDLDTPE